MGLWLGCPFITLVAKEWTVRIPTDAQYCQFICRLPSTQSAAGVLPPQSLGFPAALNTTSMMSYSQSTAVISTPSDKRAGSLIGSCCIQKGHPRLPHCSPWLPRRDPWLPSTPQTWGQHLLHFRRRTWLVVFQVSESFRQIGFIGEQVVFPYLGNQRELSWANGLRVFKASLWICGTLMLHPSPAVLRQAGHLFLLLAATHLTVNTSQQSHRLSAFWDTEGYTTSAANAVHKARTSNFTFIPVRRCAWQDDLLRC